MRSSGSARISSVGSDVNFDSFQPRRSYQRLDIANQIYRFDQVSPTFWNLQLAPPQRAVDIGLDQNVPWAFGR
jgi:hypothetical protein